MYIDMYVYVSIILINQLKIIFLKFHNSDVDEI